MNPDISHYYKILELEQGASQPEIKRAYRDLAMVWHPDRFSNPRMQQKAEARLKQINAAYEFLKSYQPQTEKPTAEPVTTKESPSTSQPTSQRKWEIHNARYGAGTRFKDVSSFLNSHIKDGNLKFTVNDALFGKDPVYYPKKLLIVVCSWEDQKYTIEIPERHTVYVQNCHPQYWSSEVKLKDSHQPQAAKRTEESVKPKDSQSTTRSSTSQPQSKQRWEIDSALYGAGNSFKDVSSLLKSKIKNGNLKLKVDDAFFEEERINDFNKLLVINFYWDGQKYTRKFAKGHTIYVANFHPQYWTSVDDESRMVISIILSIPFILIVIPIVLTVFSWGLILCLIATSVTVTAIAHYHLKKH